MLPQNIITDESVIIFLVFFLVFFFLVEQSSSFTHHKTLRIDCDALSAVVSFVYSYKSISQLKHVVSEAAHSIEIT